VGGPEAWGRLTAADLDAIGLLGAELDVAGGTLTLRFTTREEVWTQAPPDYPIDGSREVLRCRGVVYVPPPIGRAS
jgi:hypothetical protein